MNMIIIGKDCEDCKFATFDGNKVYCEQREKKYYYGQCIPCEEKEIKDES